MTPRGNRDSVQWGRRSFAAAGLLAVLAAVAAVARADDPPEPISVLVFTGTYGFRHPSIAHARARFTALDPGEFDVDLTEDPGRIDAAGLAEIDVLVLLNSGGDYPFSDAQKAELMAWRKAGGGVVGIHTPVDGNADWPEYGRMLGAVFLHHAHTGRATNIVENHGNPLVAHLPETFDLDEEYYGWQFDPRENVRVLTSIDRSSANGPWGGLWYEEAQPLSWCHTDGGRTFYTAYGHYEATYDHTGIWEMILQAVRWTAGRIEADCSPTVPKPAARLEAEHADDLARGVVRHSTLKGAELVVSEILHGGYLRFENVDLTGVRAVSVFVSPETSPRQYSWRPTEPLPALGGTIHVRVDAVASDDPAASCDFAGPCAPGTDLGRAEIPPGPPGWREVRISLAETTGVHDLFLVFSDGVSAAASWARLVAPDLVDAKHLFSVDWIRLDADAPPPPDDGPGLPDLSDLGAPGNVVVTPPLADTFSFVGTAFIPATTAIIEGTQLRLVNADVFPHDIWSREPLRDESGNVVRDQFGNDVPLFSSGVITAGQESPVFRSEKVPPGTYDFYCHIHPQMEGTLTVVGP